MNSGLDNAVNLRFEHAFEDCI